MPSEPGADVGRLEGRFQWRAFVQEQVTAWADIILSVLALVMLGLLLVEFTGVAPPRFQEAVTDAQVAIWAVFVVAFLVELWVAPSRTHYLRTHWLVLLSLLLPFLRVFRVARAFRVLRATRALRAVALGRLFGALNRSRAALARFGRFSQFAFVVALTGLVILSAAAGAYYLERDLEGTEVPTVADALWWAATLVTTVGGEAELHSAEGRLLSLLLRLFGVSVIGYLTARLAAFLLRAETAEDPEAARVADEVAALRAEVLRLRHDLARPAAAPSPAARAGGDAAPDAEREAWRPREDSNFRPAD